MNRYIFDFSGQICGYPKSQGDHWLSVQYGDSIEDAREGLDEHFHNISNVVTPTKRSTTT